VVVLQGGLAGLRGGPGSYGQVRVFSVEAKLKTIWSKNDEK
jgi:hypothetical protein